MHQVQSVIVVSAGAGCARARLLIRGDARQYASRILDFDDGLCGGGSWRHGLNVAGRRI